MNEERLKLTLHDHPPKELVSESEWSDWRMHPVTKLFFAFAKKQVQEEKDLWLNASGYNRVELSMCAAAKASAFQNMVDLEPYMINEALGHD